MSMPLVRRFWLAAVCTLAGLWAASAAQAQQHKLLPSDTEAIVTINLQQILKSEVVKGNEALLKTVQEKFNEKIDEQGVGKWLKKAGFDPFRDLTSITVAVPGGERNPQEGFVILEGNFDADKIEEAATEASKEAGGGLTIARIAGIKAYEVSPKDEKTIYIGILNNKTMFAAASKEDFAGAVARFNGTKASALKSELKTLLETVNNKQSFSAVATGPMVQKLSENLPNVPKQAADKVKKLEGLAISVTVQKNIDFQLAVTVEDNKTAMSFADIGNLFITGARLQIGQKAQQEPKLAPVADILQTLRAEAQGKNLILRGQVTFDTLTKILQNLPIPNN